MTFAAGAALSLLFALPVLAGGPSSYCLGDLNQDRYIGFIDLGMLASRMFRGPSVADLNGDGETNFADLGILKGRFFVQCPVAPVPPELQLQARHSYALVRTIFGSGPSIRFIHVGVNGEITDSEQGAIEAERLAGYQVFATHEPR